VEQEPLELTVRWWEWVVGTGQLEPGSWNWAVGTGAVGTRAVGTGNGIRALGTSDLGTKTVGTRAALRGWSHGNQAGWNQAVETGGWKLGQLERKP
jgi:hypothetical protein